MKDSELFPVGGGSASASYSNPLLTYKILKNSQVWVAPMDCIVDILIMGGHGGGAASRTPTTGTTYLTTGAGAAETVIKLGVVLLAGQTITINIGAGGLGAIIPAVTTAYQGIAGGNGSPTQVTGPNGLAMIAMPGYGGLTGNGGIGAYIPGGDGGYDGSGGDIHYAGGNGGLLCSSIAGVTYPTGSGAPNFIYGGRPNTAQAKDTSKTRGGNKGRDSLSVPSTAPTGGGGSGGRGGDQLGTTTTASFTGGGGYGGDAIDLTDTMITAASFGGPNAFGQLPATAIAGLPSPAILAASLIGFGLDIYGGGNGAATPTTGNAVNGGGGCGVASAAASSKAGFCGGMGGTYAAATLTGHSGTGQCSPGQSVLVTGSTSASARGGDGDSGICILAIRRKI